MKPRSTRYLRPDSNPNRSKPVDYLAHLAAEPATIAEMAQRTGRHVNTILQLIPKLSRWGVVEKAGVKRTCGRPAVTWGLTIRGRQIVGSL